jgi:hypothetical protein
MRPAVIVAITRRFFSLVPASAQATADATALLSAPGRRR